MHACVCICECMYVCMCVCVRMHVWLNEVMYVCCVCFIWAKTYGAFKLNELYLAQGQRGFGSRLAVMLFTHGGRSFIGFTYTKPLMSDKVAKQIVNDVMHQMRHVEQLT